MDCEVRSSVRQKYRYSVLMYCALFSTFQMVNDVMLGITEDLEKGRTGGGAGGRVDQHLIEHLT